MPRALAIVCGVWAVASCSTSNVQPSEPSGIAEPAAVTPALPAIASTIVVREDKYPRHDVFFANGVQSIPEVAFAKRIGFRPLTLDLYLPPKSAPHPITGFPLVVYVHGGAWLGGDKRHSGPFVDFPSVLASLAARGYVVASIEYRLSGEAKFPAQVQDVKAAIRWLRRHAATYSIDPARAVAWGESSGGHLAALVGVSCGAAGLEPGQQAPKDASDCVQGAVSWYGTFDLSTIAKQAREAHTMSRDDRDAPEWQLLGCFADQCSREQLAAASPIRYVGREDAPMLLVVGNEDSVVPYVQSLQMSAQLDNAGVRAEMVTLAGVDHGFIGRTPADTRDAALQAMQSTFRFIDETIGRPQAPAPVQPVSED
jgi:acetyl esterase/lipase